jgi:hypothetical protein
MLGHHSYLSEDGTTVSLVQIHHDTESAEHHLQIVFPSASPVRSWAASPEDERSRRRVIESSENLVGRGQPGMRRRTVPTRWMSGYT